MEAETVEMAVRLSKLKQEKRVKQECRCESRSSKDKRAPKSWSNTVYIECRCGSRSSNDSSGGVAGNVVKMQLVVRF